MQLQTWYIVIDIRIRLEFHASTIVVGYRSERALPSRPFVHLDGAVPPPKVSLDRDL